MKLDLALPSRYGRVHSLIGEGSSARVFRVWDTWSERDVALKVLAPSRGHRQALEAELRAATRLSHPGFVHIFDTGETGDGLPYVAMEWADAGAFDRYIDRPPPWPHILRLTLEGLDALAFAHARGVIHGDVKPANLLLQRTADGTLRSLISDFGIARVIEGGTEHTEGMRGSPLYMAPEQIDGPAGALGPWTDLYAVGGILFRIVAARAPFPGNKYAVLLAKMKRAAPRPRLRPEYPVPVGLERVIGRALVVSPDGRYRTAEDLARDLRALGPPVAQSSSGARGRELTAEPLTSSPPAPWRATALPLQRPRVVVQPRSQPPDDPRIAAGRRAPLTHRSDALDELWQAAGALLRAREAGVMWVRGAAGTGKTRLIRELIEAFGRTGAASPLTATWEVDAGQEVAPALATARWLRVLHGRRELAEGRIARFCEATGGRDEALEAALLDWLRPEDAAPGPVLPLVGGREMTGMIGLDLGLLSAVLARAATRGLAVLVFEDIHRQHADSAVRLARNLCALARDASVPLVVVLSSRLPTDAGDPPFAALLRREPKLLEITLGDLEPRRMRALMGGILPLTDGTAVELLRHAEGRPGRAVESIRYLAAAGALRREGGRWAVADRAHFRALSRIGEEALVEARLEAAEAAVAGFGAPELLAVTAAAGALRSRGLITAAMRRLGRADPAVDAAWRLLVAERVLGEDAAGDVRWLDPRVAAQVTAALRRSPTRRQILEAVLGALRELPQRRAAPKTAALLLELGRPQEALSAIEALPEVAATPAEASARLGLLRACAEALGLSVRDPVRLEIRRRSADLAMAQGRLDAAADLLAEGLREAGRGPIKKEELGLLLAAQGRCLLLRGELDGAVESLDRALEMARRRPRLAVRVRLLQGSLAHRRGARDAAISLFVDALGQAEEIGDGFTVIDCAWRLAAVYRELTRFDEALSIAEVALDGARGGGRPDIEARCLRELGNLANIRGDREQAAELLDASLNLLRRLGKLDEMSDTLISLGELHRSAGEIERAVESYSSAWQLASSQQLVNPAAVAALNLSLCCLAQGAFEAARDWTARAGGLLGDGDHWLRPYQMAARANACAGLGDGPGLASAIDALPAQSLPDADYRGPLESAASLASKLGAAAAAARIRQHLDPGPRQQLRGPPRRT